jgi:hypothetical protein
MSAFERLFHEHAIKESKRKYRYILHERYDEDNADNFNPGGVHFVLGQSVHDKIYARQNREHGGKRDCC